MTLHALYLSDKFGNEPDRHQQEEDRRTVLRRRQLMVLQRQHQERQRQLQQQGGVRGQNYGGSSNYHSGQQTKKQKKAMQSAALQFNHNTPPSNLMLCFTKEEILQHTKVLRDEYSAVFSSKEMRNRLTPVLDMLMQDPVGDRLFCVKVDPSPQGYALPDYFNIIKHPMDLGTIQKNLLNGTIKTAAKFVEHVELTFKNAMRYNPYKEGVWMEAERLLKMFKSEMKKVSESMRKEALKKHNDEICVICTGKKFLFVPAEYTCNGTMCKGIRIKRNAIFWHDKQNKFHWCKITSSSFFY
jgi:hypothetical protein